jgi:hypothetical protein
MLSNLGNSIYYFSALKSDFNYKNIYLKNRFDEMRDLKRKLREPVIIKKRKKKIKEPKVKKYRWDDIPLDDRPFIENHYNQYKDRPFEKGFGIDFYIDGARFLPDNVTVTKVIFIFLSFLRNKN